MNQTQIMSALRDVPLFQELDEPALQEVASLTRHRAYLPQTALFHAGDPGHMLYIIVTGQVRIEKVSASGEMIHLASRGRGDHFGELALLDGKPRMASVVTVSDCVCLTIEREAFQQCLRNAPSVSSQIMATLAERLREAADALEAVQELDVLGRLCKALLELTPDYGPNIDGASNADRGTAEITLRITHQQLGDRIGATRESVTRALSGLRKTGLVRTRGSSLTLLDPEALRRRCAA